MPLSAGYARLLVSKVFDEKAESSVPLLVEGSKFWPCEISLSCDSNAKVQALAKVISFAST